MQKYIPYIALAVVILVGGIYLAISAKKGNAPQTNNTENANHGAMNHETDGQPIAQSHSSYNIQLTSSAQNIKSGQPAKISFEIVNDRKEVVKNFTIAHEKLMHLIVVRKDLQNFQHLHPDFNSQTGEFTQIVTFATDGPYRIFPDFTPAPENPQKLPVTVNYDFNVGDLRKYNAVPVVATKNMLKQDGGYRINYNFPEEVKAQTSIEYSLIVEKDNEQIKLEPYLGAMGHSVIIKEGTLNYIHTHAMDIAEMDHEMPGGVVMFSTSFPEPGIYKVFTQFKAKGEVITTDYAVKVN